jgi:O-glycosyl hydrolase
MLNKLLNLCLKHLSFFINFKKVFSLIVLLIIPVSGILAQTITINKNIKYQTIDGFGFFGAQDVWWTDENLYSDAWATLCLKDLGLSIWRNEYYPPIDPNWPDDYQDADWNKQKPVVQGLKKIADQLGVPLKFIFTVWSPPAALKCALDDSLNILSGVRHPTGTKWGGTLDTAKFSQFADWLKAGIKNYKDVGIDLYAFSCQNEPYFYQPFNSCFYQPDWYVNMINGVIPTVKATYPNIKVFGPEHMLESEGGDGREWFYTNEIKQNANATNNIDILAVHGYSDGVNPTSGSMLATLWTNFAKDFSTPMNKNTWMTETSGYMNTWESSENSEGVLLPGAFNLAMDIHAALSYGNVSGWLWWQGSENLVENGESGQPSEFGLMSGTTVGKKYYACKHFYRFIRPGAQRIQSSTTDDLVFVTSYYHPTDNTYTIVILNSDYADKNVTLTLQGAGFPSRFDKYQTNATPTDNCKLIGSVTANSTIAIPARSITTLYAGGDPLGTGDIENKTADPIVEVYPNPVTDICNIVIYDENMSAAVISIIDSEGKIVKKSMINQGSIFSVNSINIEDLPAGCYILSIESNGKITNKKIIKN